MVNGSFVFGMDDDDESVFDRTVDWAIEQGIETATFQILTPYPGTPLHDRMVSEGRILSRDWDLYDTTHAVFQPLRMSPRALEAGFHRAKRRFSRWGSIYRSSHGKRNFPRSCSWTRGRLRWSYRVCPRLATSAALTGPATMLGAGSSSA